MELEELEELEELAQHIRLPDGRCSVCDFEFPAPTTLAVGPHERDIAYCKHNIPVTQLWSSRVDVTRMTLTPVESWECTHAAWPD
jgi:hypothetical protein